MSIPKKEQKFRISLSRNDLLLFQSYLSKDLDNIIENAPLLADIQKAIRKIDFQVLEASHSAAPKTLSHSYEKVVEKAEEESKKAAFEEYMDPMKVGTLSAQGILVAIQYKSEQGMELTKEEKEVLNEEMMKKMGL